MTKNKSIKDPVYGYIYIPEKIIENIIDTASFQRLRRITQTSYAPLYSSAVHNRFVHSLGVYHLGQIAGKSMSSEINEKYPNILSCEDINQYKEVFCLACLLHDVGHAPFSHTGEKFFLDNNGDYKTIHNLLIEAVSENEFENDIPTLQSEYAAPHEIMSAIIGLNTYNSFFSNNEEKSFFARCITGYKYKTSTTANSVKNCFIQLLNSTIIDVDKLDYLIRDSYITGFNSAEIDYERLLTSITVTYNSDEEQPIVELAYKKSAISVIENVVYAHDSERKWLQSHPVVLYETYILQNIMKFLSDQLNTADNKLFSLESLSKEGQLLKGNEQIRLLCDDDIIFLMKKYYGSNKMISEYLDRKIRRHPLWKSEAEYKALFRHIISSGELIDKIENSLKLTTEYLSKNTDNWVISNSLITSLEDDINSISSTTLDQKSKNVQIRNKSNILKVINCIMNFANNANYNGDFVLLKASQFYSGFLKPDFSKIKIIFPFERKEQIMLFGDGISSLSGIDSKRDNFFYLFYDRDQQTEVLDGTELCSSLIKTFVDL